MNNFPASEYILKKLAKMVKSKQFSTTKQSKAASKQIYKVCNPAGTDRSLPIAIKKALEVVDDGLPKTSTQIQHPIMPEYVPRIGKNLEDITPIQSPDTPESDSILLIDETPTNIPLEPVHFSIHSPTYPPPSEEPMEYLDLSSLQQEKEPNPQQHYANEVELRGDPRVVYKLMKGVNNVPTSKTTASTSSTVSYIPTTVSAAAASSVAKNGESLNGGMLLMNPIQADSNDTNITNTNKTIKKPVHFTHAKFPLGLKGIENARRCISFGVSYCKATDLRYQMVSITEYNPKSEKCGKGIRLFVSQWEELIHFRNSISNIMQDMSVGGDLMFGLKIGNGVKVSVNPYNANVEIDYYRISGRKRQITDIGISLDKEEWESLLLNSGVITDKINLHIYDTQSCSFQDDDNEHFQQAL